MGKEKGSDKGRAEEGGCEGKGREGYYIKWHMKCDSR